MAADPLVVDVIVTVAALVAVAGWGVWLHRSWRPGWREVHRERRADRRCAHRLTTTAHRRTR